jgi:hypothetical protein
MGDDGRTGVGRTCSSMGNPMPNLQTPGFKMFKDPWNPNPKFERQVGMFWFGHVWTKIDRVLSKYGSNNLALRHGK